MLRLAQEMLLLILDNDDGDIVASLPTQSLNTLLAGAVLMDLELENRIDTDLVQVVLVDATPVGDDLLDPVLADIARDTESRTIDYWLERTAMQGDEIREKALAKLVEQGIVQSDESISFFLSSRVRHSRRYPIIHGTITEEVQFRIMRLLFSDDIPDPRDIVLVSLAAAGDVFKHILSREELAEAQDRIDLISRMDLIGQAVARALRSAKAPTPVPSVRPAAEIPQASGWPLIGNAIDMAGDLRGFLTRKYLKHGPIFQIRALNRRFIALVGPEANQFVDKQGHNHLRSYETWRDFHDASSVMRTVIGMDGPEHLRMRKVLAKGYSSKIIEGRLDDVVAITRRAIDEWSESEAISTHHAFQKLVIEQIGLLLTSYSARDYADDLIVFFETLLMTTVRRQWPKQIDYWPPVRRARKRVMELCAETLASHCAEDRDSRSADFIDALLEVRAEDPQLLPETDLPMAALGPFVAGVDTSASVCSYALYALLAHPELLEQVTTEVDDLFERGPLTAKGLHTLDVTHRVLLETLRIYPVIPGAIRVVSNSFDFGGYTVPAGAQVLIGNTVSHHLPELFPDPQRFDIERYRRTPPEHRQPGAYAPFGVGRHHCLASGFAQVQIMATIATIVRDGEFALERPNRPLKIKYTPTYHPSFEIRLVRRRGGGDWSDP